jgi:hypothetical protein
VLQKASGFDYATQWSTPSGGTWGSITGTLSAQTDLQSALNAKLSTATAASTYFPIPTGNTTQYIAGDGTLITFPTLATANKLTATVYNETGSTITKGSVVYIVGAHGNLPTIALSQANAESTSAGTYGLVSANIGNNSSGTIVIAGVIENLDTQALADGDKLYLSPSVAGGYTTTKPSAPYHMVYVGVVTRAHPTQGTIQLRIANGFELGEIHDVKLTSPSNDQVLKFDSAQGLWVNGNSAADYISSVTAPLAVTTGNLTVDLSAYLPVSGGTLDANGTITASTSTVNSLFAGDAFGVELTANPSQNASLQYDGVHVQNIAGTMLVTASGLTFPNSSTQTVAYPGSTGFLLKADNLSGLADTGTARTNLGLGTMATATAADYSTTTVANGLYYPLSGNPSSFLVAADIAGKANSANAALTGNVTITTNSASPALIITQDGTGDIVQFKDVAGDTTYTFIDANGKVTTIPAVTASAGFNIPHGTAPTTFANGDIWTTTGGLFAYINGGTRQFATLSDGFTYSGNNTFAGPTLVFGNTTAASTIGIGTGATISGSTRTISIGTGSAAGSTNNINIGGGSGTITTTLNGTTNFTGPITGAINNITLGNGTAASAFNLFTGATISGSTKAVSIATGGAAGSTTTVTIGNTTGSTTTLQGTTNGITAAADTNSTGLATTAFVVGQAGSATPVVNGTAAVGTSLRYARQDHVHPTDTSRAALASPTFTGTPLSTTAAADTNTTQIATTAFVVGQASSTAPVIDGTATVGTSLKYARADHVHPTDTSRAPLASPAFTGTPSLPTGTTAVTQTAGNNTTAVATTAFVTAAVPAFATLTEARQFSNTTKVLSPSLAMWSMLSADIVYIQRSNFTVTNTGAISYSNLGAVSSETRFTTAGVATTKQRTFGVSNVDQSQSMTVRSNISNFFNFSKPTYLAGRSGISDVTEAVITAAFYYGKADGDAVGDLTRRGFGWKFTGGTGSRFLTLQVHNGTTLTNVTSSFAATTGVAFDWDIISDGAGNVTLYVNGSSVATSSAGPTGLVNVSPPVIWQEEASASAAVTGSFFTIYHSRGRMAVINY